MDPALDTLCGPGKPLKAEASEEQEMAGLLRTGMARIWFLFYSCFPLIYKG